MTRESSNLTEKLNIRVTADEKNELEERAKRAGMSFSKWGRAELLRATWPNREERRQVEISIVGYEIMRLTFLNLGKADVHSEEFQTRIEREAKANASAILDRWLNLPAAKKGAY
jgi:preprotein translocase subunit SecE